MIDNEGEKEDISNNRRLFMFGGAALVGAAGLASQLARADVSGGGFVLPTVFDVTQYGADSNRSKLWTAADAAPAFNSAIAAAAAAGGGIVFAPRGFYIVKSTILVNHSNIRIIGEGRGVTTIAGCGVSGAIISFNASASDPQIVNCGVEDLTLYGSSDPLSADYCIALFHTSKSSFRNLELTANLYLTAGNSLMYIVRSWINNFYDIHFTGVSPYASLRIHRPSGVESSNSLNFYGCNFLSSSTPHGVVIEGADVVGDVFNFNGINLQGYGNGSAFWVKRGEAINIQGFYGEGNNIDIRLGDSDNLTYANGVTIEGWRTFNSSNSIYLDLCRNVKVGPGLSQQTKSAPILVGSVTGGFLFGRNIQTNQDNPSSTNPPFVKFTSSSYSSNQTGLMIFDGDSHEYPDWPGTPNPMGIILKADASTTFGKHFKIYVDNTGAVQTHAYTLDSNGYLKG